MRRSKTITDCLFSQLLLLLRSPTIPLGLTILGEIFGYVTDSFNPSIEAVTSRLREWCMPGVFMLPAFTRPGQERQDLSSLCDGMLDCVHKLDLGSYSHQKEFGGNGVRTHVNFKGKILSTGKKSPQRRIEPMTLRQAGQRAQHTTNQLFRPLLRKDLNPSQDLLGHQSTLHVHFPHWDSPSFLFILT